MLTSSDFQTFCNTELCLTSKLPLELKNDQMQKCSCSSAVRPLALEYFPYGNDLSHFI